MLDNASFVPCDIVCSRCSAMTLSRVFSNSQYLACQLILHCLHWSVNDATRSTARQPDGCIFYGFAPPPVRASVSSSNSSSDVRWITHDGLDSFMQYLPPTHMWLLSSYLNHSYVLLFGSLIGSRVKFFPALRILAETILRCLSAHACLRTYQPTVTCLPSWPSTRPAMSRAPTERPTEPYKPSAHLPTNRSLVLLLINVV